MAFTVLVLIGVHSVAHGIVCDGKTDSSTFMQALVDDACKTDPPRPLILPSTPGSSCLWNKPVIIGCDRLKIAGAGKWSTVIKETSRGAWTLAAIPSSVPPYPIGAPLVSHSAGSMHTNGRWNDPWIELKDLGDYGNLNGLSAVTIEAFVTLHSNATGCLVASGGRHLTIDPVQGALELCIDGNHHWYATLTTTVGGLHIVTDPGVAVTRSRRFVAASYNGSTLSLYVAGPSKAGVAPVATTTVTGTVVQKAWESFTIGKRAATTWEANNSLPGLAGTVDGFRLSNIGRYTGILNPEPPAVLPPCDVNCLAEWTGQTYYHGHVLVFNNKGGTRSYLIPRDQNFYIMEDVELSDFGIDNGGAPAGPGYIRSTNGIFYRGCVDCAVRHVQMGQSGQIAQGLYLFNNSFGDILDDIRINYQGWFGIAANLACGYIDGRGWFTQGGPGPGFIGTAGISGSAYKFQNLVNETGLGHMWLEGTEGAVFDSFVATAAAFDTENMALPAQPPFLEGVVDSNFNSLTMVGGQVEVPTGAPAFRFDSLGANPKNPSGSVQLINVGIDRPTPFTGVTPFLDFVGSPPKTPVVAIGLHGPNVGTVPFVSTASNKYVHQIPPTP